MSIQFDANAVTPELVRLVASATTPERAFAVFRRIAETPGPSQTVSYSRGRAIAEVVEQFPGDLPPGTFDLDFQGTGNVVLQLAPTPKIVFVAHADEISYLVGNAELLPGHPQADPEAVPLIPFCNHSAQIDWAGSAWRYDVERGHLRQAATGTIHSQQQDGRWRAWFRVEEGEELHPGDRIVYTTPARRHGDLLQGKVDNALGVAALLLAAGALRQAGRHPPVWFLFSDEEEGPPQTNAGFARALRRLIHSVPLPPETLFVEIDGHEVAHSATPGPSAYFAEKAKFCQGVVVPPDLYARFQGFAAALRARGIDIRANTGYVSRSDSVAVMERYRNVMLWGYQVKDTHYRHGWPTASLRALVALARTVAGTALAVG